MPVTVKAEHLRKDGTPRRTRSPHPDACYRCRYFGTSERPVRWHRITGLFGYFHDDCWEIAQQWGRH